MHRPLRVPLYLRIWQFVKNLLVLNRVDWHKASDGLNLPTLSREERERRRPKADMEIIKPREKPRARIDTFRGAQISKPDQYSQVFDPLSAPLGTTEPDESETLSSDPVRQEGQYVKRRRYKRRSTSSKTGGSGFFRRVFGK